MTALPIDSTSVIEPTHITERYKRRAGWFGVDTSVLNDPAHAVPVRAWLDVMAATFKEHWNADGQFEPYDDSPVPIIHDTATAAVETLHVVPDAAPQPEATKTTSKAAEPQYTFFERYEEVHVDVFKEMSSVWAMRTTLLLFHIGDTGEVYKSVAFLADYLGEKPETLNKWARTPDCPLWTYFEMKKNHRRPTEDGTGWENYWALKPRSINRNEDGTLVDKDRDRFVQVMRWWLFEDPADHGGNEWVRREKVTAQALHVTAALRAWAGSKAGVKKAVRWIAAEFNISKATWDRGAKVAEEQGLYLHEGARSGIVAGYRKPLQRPATRRTHETRRPSEKNGYEAVEPLAPADNAETPF